VVNFLELESLSRSYIKSVYGHSYTVREIQKKFPYSNKPYKKSNTRGIVSTVNPLIAMQYRLDHKPIIEWGARITKTTHIFVFKVNTNEKQYSPMDAW
jgi:hypothetical protein